MPFLPIRLPFRASGGEGADVRALSLALFLSWGLALGLGCQSAPSAVPAPEPVAIDDPEEAASEIVHRLGLDQQLRSVSGVGDAYDESLRRLAQMGPEEERPDPERLARALTASKDAAAPAYEASRLQADVTARLARADPERLGEALAYLRSPAADEVALAKAELATGAGQQRLARFLAGGRDRDRDADRAAQAQRLVEAEGELALTVLLTWEATRRYDEILAPVLGVASAPDEEMRQAFRRSAELRLRQTAAYVASRSSPAGLQRHLAFWESPAGRWLARARYDAVQFALERAHQRASRAVDSWKVRCHAANACAEDASTL